MFEALKKAFTKDDEILIHPDPDAVKWHLQNSLTPDIAYLEQHARQNIFIPDDLMRGRMNHRLIEGNLPVHPSCYTLKPFITWQKDLGEHSFPLPFPDTEVFEIFTKYKPEPARIKGELYSLPTHFFWKVLDIHKQNTVQFRRERVSITMPYRHVTFNTDPDADMADKIPNISPDYLRTIRAWMYIANREYWDDLIGVHLRTKAVQTYQHDSPKEWISHYSHFK